MGYGPKGKPCVKHVLDQSHLMVRQDRCSIALPLRGVMPRAAILLDHVRSIVLGRTLKQMTDAWRVITGVANLRTLIRNTAMFQKPCEAMGVLHASRFMASKLTVAPGIACARPDPAWSEFWANDGAILVDLGPEALNLTHRQIALQAATTNRGRTAIGAWPRLVRHFGDSFRGVGRAGVSASRPPLIPSDSSRRAAAL